MYNLVKTMVLMCSVIYLKGTDCKVVYQCYRFYQPVWHLLTQDNAVTNIWCEHMCHSDDARFQYSGTFSNTCYCRIHEPTSIDNKSKFTCTDHFQCSSDNSTFCGGLFNSVQRLIVSKIAEQLTNLDVEVIMPACTCTNWNSLNEGDIFHCNYQATASENITIACQPNTRGRFFRIKRKDMETLTIREVDVNGDQVNSTNESGRSSTAYACGHSGYGFASPIIGTSVASSYIDCTIMCFTITACASAEYDKDANVCTLKDIHVYG